MNQTENEEEEIEYFTEDKYISTKDAKVPYFLIATYILCPIWGVVWFYLYWNGSTGWLDPGYWKQLQIAANTTFPAENQNMPGGRDYKITPQQEAQIQKDLE